jgi:glycosyltransferase involved in cell wall biosynthesis
MNIALVHDWLTNVAGAERVLLTLHEIYPNATIYTSVFDPKKAKPFADLNVKTSVLQKFPFLKKHRELLVPLAPFAFENINLSKYDLVISSTTFAAKGVITKPETTHICYCHTPTRYLWMPELDPRSDSGKFLWLRKKIRPRLLEWDKAAAQRVDYYISNSDYTGRRIKKFYNRDSVAVYPPVNVDRFKIARADKIKNYYLFVSRLVGYKRCDIVVEAFNKLGLPLKIIGSGPEKKRLQKMAKKNIEFLGFLSDDELKKYYEEAKAFIFAAEEDFGIVPVEAMSAGRPVIAFGRGGARETVVPGVTGEFFEKQSVESLTQAVRAFNPKKYNPKLIKKQAEKFSEERFKKEFRETVGRMVEEYHHK